MIRKEENVFVSRGDFGGGKGCFRKGRLEYMWRTN
jgi:hypothetical protein